MNESIVEGAALSWFSDLGYPVGQGPLLAPGGQAVERNRSAAEMGEFESFGEGVVFGRLREAIRRLNPVIAFHTHAAMCDTPLRMMISGEVSFSIAEKLVASASRFYPQNSHVRPARI
jgi:hypothetical protein